MSTKVPAVLAALLTAAQSVPNVTVIDGEPVAGQSGDFIAVGHAQQGPGVVNREQIADYGLTNPLETFDVVSQVVAWQGDTNTADCRTRAAAVVDALSDAVDADPHLGGTALLAQITATDWTQMQTTKGVMVIAQVTVSVQAAKQ